MKLLLGSIAFLVSAAAAASPPRLPIRSGQYVFAHRFAEQPNMLLTPVTVRIHGHHIVVICEKVCDGFPKGVIDEGTLMWNTKNKEWIVGESNSDRHAKDVGGCSGGPAEVDLKKRVYWTC